MTLCERGERYLQCNKMCVLLAEDGMLKEKEWRNS